MKFIDLFAGLGGFHLALARLGHKCVFACEVDEELAELYEANFGIPPARDIRDVRPDNIPAHDVLCAGFPCQPFSKAGEQRGFGCGKWGDLFDYVAAVLRYHQPAYFILENVPNLLRHDTGRTWAAIQEKLDRAGYDVHAKRLSPHKFGIPQIRERLFVVGSREMLWGFVWPTEMSDGQPSLRSVLEKNPSGARPLPPQVVRCLDAWQAFLDLYPKDEELPSFPIWSMEFGADYPFEHATPYAIGPRRLSRYRGSHGRLLREVAPDDRMGALPPYARTAEERFPDWKIAFIRQNRELYRRHRSRIARWLPRVASFPPSLQKLEWNCKGETRDIWQFVIQFRASGVRVKRPTTAPSLIAMTSTQVPIIAWEKRYMTPRECARLQSMDELSQLPASAAKAYGALGNAVNVDLVERIACCLLHRPRSERRRLPDKAAATVCVRPAAMALRDAQSSRA